ncbi:MAG: peptidylprolyl isomerase [Bacteroidota bacterium]
MKRIFLTLTVLASMLTSCNANGNKTEEPTTMATPTEPSVQPTGENKNWKETPGIYAEIVTAKGNIVIELFYKKVPITSANFIALAEGKMKNNAKPLGTPFYDGLTFHRVIHTPQPFMIQGGDPMGNGTGGPGYSFMDEFDPSLTFNKVGLLAMANSGPATNGSQFFITETATTWLNNKHSIFGEVVENYTLVPQVAQGDVMTKVNIIRVGKEAQDFDAVATFAKAAELKAQKDKAKNMTAEEYIKANNLKAQKTASGLYYVVEEEGKGAKAVAGKNVEVHYTGTLTDGSKFDSSRDRGQPLPFTLGQGQVIKGWDEGIALMSVGSKYKLIIPANLGYGANGAGGVIPPNATLVFDTELMGVK